MQDRLQAAVNAVEIGGTFYLSALASVLAAPLASGAMLSRWEFGTPSADVAGTPGAVLVPGIPTITAHSG